MQKRFPDGLPLLDPIDDMGIKDSGLKKVIQRVEAFEHRMYTHPLHSDPNLECVYTLCERKALVRTHTLWCLRLSVINRHSNIKENTYFLCGVGILDVSKVVFFQSWGFDFFFPAQELFHCT